MLQTVIDALKELTVVLIGIGWLWVWVQRVMIRLQAGELVNVALITAVLIVPALLIVLWRLLVLVNLVRDDIFTPPSADRSSDQ